MSKILFEDEYVIVIPSFKEVLPHKHSFYHLFWTGDNAEKVYIVRGEVRHVMPPLPQCKAFLMIDPTSCVADQIDKLLGVRESMTIDLLDGLEIDNKSDEDIRHNIRKCLDDNKLILNVTDYDDKDKEDYRVIKLLKEIREYKHLEKSIQEIADKYGISDSRLSHAFKECVGVSLKGYLNIMQMQYAYQLIMDGKSITYAALEAGFSSPAHLAAICKKQMGISITKVLK